jgi:hypothetical protein
MHMPQPKLLSSLKRAASILHFKLPVLVFTSGNQHCFADVQRQV